MFSFAFAQLMYYQLKLSFMQKLKQDSYNNEWLVI